MDVISYNKAASAAKAAKVAQTTADSKLDSGNFVSKNGELYKLGDGFKNSEFLVEYPGELPAGSKNSGLSLHGNTLVYGGYNSNGVVVLDTNNYQVTLSIPTPDSATSSFGRATAITAERIYVADAHEHVDEDDQGTVRIYDREGGLLNTLTGDAVEYANFGYHVEILLGKLVVGGRDKIRIYDEDGSNEVVVDIGVSDSDSYQRLYALNNGRLLILSRDSHVYTLNVDGTDIVDHYTIPNQYPVGVTPDGVVYHNNDKEEKIAVTLLDGTTEMYPLDTELGKGRFLVSGGYLLATNDRWFAVYDLGNLSLIGKSHITHWDAYRGMLVDPTTHSVYPLGSGEDYGYVQVIRQSYGVTQETTDLKTNQITVEGKVSTLETTTAELGKAPSYSDLGGQDGVVSGLTFSTSDDLTSTMVAGKAVVAGKSVEVPETTHTFTAEKDTYVDLSSEGVLVYTEVGHGDDSPELVSGIRLQLVYTNDSEVADINNLDALKLKVITPMAKGYSIGLGFPSGSVLLPNSTSTYGGSIILSSDTEVGMSMTSGTDNILIGREVGCKLTTGTYNVLIGGKLQDSPSSTGQGSYNVSIGYVAHYSVTTGYGNVAFGYYAGYKNTTGVRNIVIGDNAGYGITEGGDNIALGCNTLHSDDVNNCVAIGNHAGEHEAASDKLHIANNSDESLIEGDFANKWLNVNGDLTSTSLTTNVIGSVEDNDKLHYYGHYHTFHSHSSNVPLEFINSSDDIKGIIDFGSSGFTIQHDDSWNDYIGCSKSQGIELTTSSTKGVRANCDIEVTDAAKGIVLSSPNGTRRRLTITDDGDIQLEEL